MIPRGCDQQGRHPQAAEAATEVGIPDEPEQDMLRVVIDDALLTMVVLMLVALLAGMVVGAIYGRL